MNAASIKEKMYMYHMTTGLPISIYDENRLNFHQIGLPEIPFDFLGVYPKTINLAKNDRTFKNYLTDYEEYFLSLYITSMEGKDYTIVVGPFKYKMISIEKIKSIAERAQIGKQRTVALQKYYFSLPIAKIASINQHYKYLELLFNSTSIVFNDSEKDIMNIKSMEETMIEYREIDFYHHNYLKEKQYIDKLFKGRISPYEREIPSLELGTIANDYIRDQKNMAIVNIALLERYAIEHGLEPHISFTIGDAYLRIVEECSNLSDIDIILQDSFRKYQKALELVNKSKYSQKIILALSYINHNLSHKFSLDDVAKHVNIHPSYLSKLIKKELGMSFTDLVLKEKIEEAKLLLKYSNNTLSEISGILNFSSKSYFVKCFKKISGITPVCFKKAEGVTPV